MLTSRTWFGCIMVGSTRSCKLCSNDLWPYPSFVPLARTIVAIEPTSLLAGISGMGRCGIVAQQWGEVLQLYGPQKPIQQVDTQAMTLFSILSNTHQTTTGLSSSRILQNFRQPLQPFVENSHLKPHILLSRRNGAQCPSTPSSRSLRVSDRYLLSLRTRSFR